MTQTTLPNADDIRDRAARLPRVILLGASGFVGGAVALALADEACEVVCVPAPRLIGRAEQDLGTSLPEDASGRRLLAHHITGAAVVINCAGDPDASSRNETGLLSANAAVPGLVADVVAEVGCPRFIHVSSAVVQGRRPVLDESREYDVVSAYGRSKMMGELEVLRRAPAATVIYRPPSVHSPSRRVTRSIARLARTPLATVASPASAHSPQAHIDNVASAISHLALTPSVPPPVVIHPWEGLTTSALLRLLGSREPSVLPRRFAVAVAKLLTRLGAKCEVLAPTARRIEIIWLGQEQAESWLSVDGWKPAAEPGPWQLMGSELRPRGERGHERQTLEQVGGPASGPTVLIVSSVASMIDNFNIPNIELLVEKGLEVHVACNFRDGNTISPNRIASLQQRLDRMGVKYHQVDIPRKPTSICKLHSSLGDLNRIALTLSPTFIHCHSPIGAALARLVAKRNRIPTLYTAHGFHFHKGSSPFSWVTYFPIERFLAKHTTILATINREDYRRALGWNATRVVLLPGVGVHTERFGRAHAQVSRLRLRDQLKLSATDKLIASVGELNANKNHAVIVAALASLPTHVHYVVSGCGFGDASIERLAQNLGVSSRVHLLGYQEMVEHVYAAADLFVLPSKREGLPVSLIEAMASSLPCLGSDVRGIRDLIGHPDLPALLPPDDPDAWAKSIQMLFSDPHLCQAFASRAKELAERFDTKSAMDHIAPIYTSLLQSPTPAISNLHRPLTHKPLLSAHREHLYQRLQSATVWPQFKTSWLLASLAGLAGVAALAFGPRGAALACAVNDGALIWTVERLDRRNVTAS